MDAPQFDVIVEGQVLPGFEPADVIIQLQQQLKLPEVKARQLIAAKAIVVKRGVSSDVAQAYCTRLQTIGVAARLAPVASVSASPAAATTADYFAAHTAPLDSAQLSSSYRRELYVAALHLNAIGAGYMLATFTVIGLLLFYLVHFSYLLTAPPILFSVTVFLIPLLALSLLVVLMLRPLLPTPQQSETAISIDREHQPQIVDFAERITTVLALPMPAQIAVNTQTRNSVSLMPGLKNFWNCNYQLTLSLPLLDNASLKEFGAIVAGDLALGARSTMLRYRWLNEWWRTRLDTCAKGADWLHQQCIVLIQRCENTRFAFARKPLYFLSAQSDASLHSIAKRIDRLDNRLLRARQYEQDRYRALIGGSGIIANALLLESKIDTAMADASALNQQQHDTGKAVDDFAALVQHYFASLDDDFARQLKQQWNAATTPRRHEPALPRERIEESLSLPQTSILSSTAPASTLLQSRSQLARKITEQHYRALDWSIVPSELLAVDELTYAATQDILLRQQAQIYFNNWFKPFRFWSLADYRLIHDMPMQDAAQQLNVCISEIRRLTPDRAKLLAEYQRLINQVQEILLGQHVLAVGKKFAFRTIAYDGTTLQPILEEKQELLNKVVEQLSQQEAVMGGRITLGLRLCGQAERDVELLHDALRMLRECGARLDKISLDAYQLEQLLHRHHRQREANYSAAITRLEQKIEDTLMLLMTRLSSIANPLDKEHRPLKYHLDTALNKTGNNEKFETLRKARCALDTLYALNERLSTIAADYGTIAEEAYRIDSIKLINTTID